MTAAYIGDLFMLFQTEKRSAGRTLEFFDLLAGFGSFLAVFRNESLQAMLAIGMKTWQRTWIL
jgi:hypothetical protein